MRVSREELKDVFVDKFGVEPELAIVSPGRTEIAGNHTDHEGGHVIAAAVDRAVHGLAGANEANVIRLVSLGFGEVEVELGDAQALRRVKMSARVRRPSFVAWRRSLWSRGLSRVDSTWRARARCWEVRASRVRRRSSWLLPRR